VTTDHLLALVLALALAAVHIFAGRLRFVPGPPRARALSVAGGISVAYVFVHLLPELSRGEETLADAVEAFGERHVYVVALLGLALFYGAEQAVLRARRRRHHAASTPTSEGMFRVHLATFVAYSALIGNLVVQQVELEGFGRALLFAFALGVHLIVNDTGLRLHHRDRYHDVGRWMLAVAVLVGWISGSVLEISEPAKAALLALLAGGVILNVLKEELPPDRESRFWAFAGGAAGYSVLLLLLG
jgi:hypothetical protein